MSDLSVGVVIPHRNHELSLRKALEHLHNDPAKAVNQIVVVDDYSNPNARSVVRELITNMPSVKLIELAEHRGVAGALNVGIENIQTDLIHFSAADDILDLRLLSAARQRFADRPEASIFSARTRLVSDLDGHDLGTIPSPIPYSREGWVSPENARRSLMRRDSWIFGNSSVYRRDRLLEAGSFNPNLGSFCDGFVQRLMAARWGALFDERPLGHWRRSDSGVAAQATLDTNKLLELSNIAYEMFQQHTPSIFPPGYAERWRRRWLCGGICFQIDRGVSSGLSHPVLQDFGPNWFLRLANRSRDLGPVGTLLAKVLLFATLRPFDIGEVAFRRIELRFRR